MFPLWVLKVLAMAVFMPGMCFIDCFIAVRTCGTRLSFIIQATSSLLFSSFVGSLVRSLGTMEKGMLADRTVLMVPVRSNASSSNSNLPLFSLPLTTRYHRENAVPRSNDIVNFASCIVGRFFRARSNDFVCKKNRRRATKRNKASFQL